MGTKYYATFARYPYLGYAEHSVQSRYVIVFAVKLLLAVWRYPIIDITFRAPNMSKKRYMRKDP